MSNDERTHKKAIWFPSWYELDQSIEVDDVDDFDFFVNIPNEFKEDVDLVFHCGPWRKGQTAIQRVKIVSISNQHFGAVQKIDTVGLDYTLVFPNG